MRLVSVAFVALVLSPAVARGAGETSIFFYPWWGTPKHNGKYLHWNYGQHLPPADLASTFYPARGVYSSADTRVLRGQLKEIRAIGIDEVVSSWWGWGSPEDARLPAVMREAKRHQLKVAVQVEPYEKWLRTAKVLAADLGHLREIGIRRVYVYRPFDEFLNEDVWAELLSGLPELEIYGQTSDLVRAAAAGFDGVYTYDVFATRGASFAGLCRRARAAGLACAPSVGPGYNAHRATTDPDHRIRPRRGGKTYDEMWRAAIKASPDRITITSYNEWHEGTQIEAARRRPTTIYGTYASYEGAYGRNGRPAERAYLVRTAYWTKTYRVAAAARRLVRLATTFWPS
jgi:glycoprotein endo-alpha-1,2-mannosidase